MNSTGFTTQRQIIGEYYEKRIHPSIEKVINQKIIKSPLSTSKYDVYSDDYNIEIKTRNIKSTDYNEWMCVSTKFINSGKKIILFYYFIGDDKLFYIEYDIKKFSTYKLRYIYANNQYLIPSKDFIEVYNHNVILLNE